MVRYELKEKILDVEGLSIAYTEIGPKDGPLVFCMHGLLSTGRDFDFLGRALAKRGYRCIAMDLPGRGKSDCFNHYMQYVPPNYLPYCLAVLEHEAPGQEFCWLGVSLGGILGMMLHEALGVGETLGKKIIETMTMPIELFSEVGKTIQAPRGFFTPRRTAVSASAPAALFTQFRKSIVEVDDTDDVGDVVDEERSTFDMASLPKITAKMTRLILIDIGGEIPARGLDIVAQVAHMPRVYDTFEGAVGAIKKRCVAWCIKGDEIWEHLFKHNIIRQEDGTYAMHYDEGIGMVQPKSSETLSLWHLWDGIRQPVFLVRGGKSRILPEEVAERMRERYRGERFTEIVYESCGHIPNVMEEAHVNALVTWIEGTQK
jgi:pimeloyl-ACP methyl ester carboxylesterase